MDRWSVRGEKEREKEREREGGREGTMKVVLNSKTIPLIKPLVCPVRPKQRPLASSWNKLTHIKGWVEEKIHT